MPSKILITSNYNTDTGCGDLGSQYIMPGDTCYLDVLKEAKKRGALLIVKTSYVSEKRPGAWYIKGYTKGNYDSILHSLIENQKNGRYSKRRAILIKYSS